MTSRRRSSGRADGRALEAAATISANQNRRPGGAIRAAVPAPRRFRPSPPAAAPDNRKEHPVAVVSMRELLEAGVHFGHQTRRWNPKMRRFIFTERGGIYIIDLQQTLGLVEEAYQFVRNLAERGGSILFVGTKKQAQDAVVNEAKRVGMPYVANRWLGGLLTNWRTMSDRIGRLHELRRLREEGQLDLLPPKERLAMLGELEKLEANLGGVADMKRQPDAVFILDLRKEQLAVREARRLGLPIVALVDTNCDPDEADYVIPGNDDAIRSCSLITRVIGQAVADGRAKLTPQELAAPRRGRQAPAETPAEAATAAEAPAAPPAEPAPPASAESAAAAETPAEAPAEAAPAPPAADETPAAHEVLSQGESAAETAAAEEVEA